VAKIEDSDPTVGAENMKKPEDEDVTRLGGGDGGNTGNGGNGGDGGGGDDEEDDARSRSLKLGGTGPNLGFLGKYAKFLGEVREEMRKVTWPTRKMVITETIVVLVVLVFFTLLITGLDQVFAVVFNKLLFNK
jgi:preprotein translocase subunit SecE